MADTLRLYLDECVHAKAAQAFRDAGVDAVGVHDWRTLKLYDEEQLERATADGRMILTYNAGDFARLHDEWLAVGREHAGILLARDYKQHVGALVRDVRSTVADHGRMRQEDGYRWLRNELLWVRRSEGR